MKKYLRMVALQGAVRKDIIALTGDLRCLASSKKVIPESATYYVIYNAIRRLTTLHAKLSGEINLQFKDNAKVNAKLLKHLQNEYDANISAVIIDGEFLTLYYSESEEPFTCMALYLLAKV